MTVHLLLHRVHIDPCPLCKEQCKGHELAGDDGDLDFLWTYLEFKEEK